MGVTRGLLHGEPQRPSAASADSLPAPPGFGEPRPRAALGEEPRGWLAALPSLGEAARWGLGAGPAWRGRSWGEAPGVWVRVCEAARGTGMEEAKCGRLAAFTLAIPFMVSGAGCRPAERGGRETVRCGPPLPPLGV